MVGGLVTLTASAAKSLPSKTVTRRLSNRAGRSPRATGTKPASAMFSGALKRQVKTCQEGVLLPMLIHHVVGERGAAVLQGVADVRAAFHALVPDPGGVQVGRAAAKFDVLAVVRMLGDVGKLSTFLPRPSPRPSLETSLALMPSQCLGLPFFSTCSKSPFWSRLPTLSGEITDSTNGFVTAGSFGPVERHSS